MPFSLQGSGLKCPAGTTRYMGKVKQTDYTNTSKARICHSNVAVMYIKRANGDIGYKAQMRLAIIKEKKSTKDLELISVLKHKKEAALD